MCTINLKEILDNNTFPQAGGILYDMIEAKLDCPDKIVLNLDGVVSLPSMFLNVSIGKFIEVHGVNLLKDKLSFSQISVTQAQRIKDYINLVSVPPAQH